MEETKQDRFKRLAESRANKLMDGMISLGKLSNTSNYEYTEEQIEKIFGALESELKRQKLKFKLSKVKKRNRVRL